MRLVMAHPDRPAGVTIVTHVQMGRHIVQGDDDLLHRAVFNLLLNAVQASPLDGEVRIEVTAPTQEQIGSSTAFLGGAVALTVSDDGPGIDPSIRDRLFDPFFTTRPGGSGLGLAVVHRAIDAHRGLVFLDSGAAGTRFTIVLPCLSRMSRDEQVPKSTHAPVYT
jgi:two-component system sensor histidine kinase PilS (NtrC family)